MHAGTQTEDDNLGLRKLDGISGNWNREKPVETGTWKRPRMGRKGNCQSLEDEEQVARVYKPTGWVEVKRKA